MLYEVLKFQEDHRLSVGYRVTESVVPSSVKYKKAEAGDFQPAIVKPPLMLITCPVA